MFISIQSLIFGKKLSIS